MKTDVSIVGCFDFFSLPAGKCFKESSSPKTEI